LPPLGQLPWNPPSLDYARLCPGWMALALALTRPLWNTRHQPTLHHFFYYTKEKYLKYINIL